MNLERERLFKYTAYIYHLLLYYQSDSFPVFLKKLDARGEQRSVIFWTSLCHLVSESLLGPYNTSDYAITIVVIPPIYIVVPLLPPCCYFCAS